ncbi:hypothetical protein GCM10027514_44240 [Azotobacter armeniacus]
MGHEVRLLAPRSVRPFVLHNKNDAADAQAIWTAVQQPGACQVAIKQADQQAILSLQRIRAQLLKVRIIQSNALRGLFYGFGMVLPEDHARLAKAMPEAFAHAEGQDAIQTDAVTRRIRQRSLGAPATAGSVGTLPPSGQPHAIDLR